jgi:predicted SprT family Zn-dependent metalloprotease
MKNKFSRSNNIDKPEYKAEDICAGLKCPNKPISILKVRYINKIGYFCQKCNADLLQQELAEEISKEVVLND